MMTYGAMDLLAHERMQEARQSAERDRLADLAVEAARSTPPISARGRRPLRGAFATPRFGLPLLTRGMRGKRHLVTATMSPAPRVTHAAQFGATILKMLWLAGPGGTPTCRWIKSETVDLLQKSLEAAAA